MNFKDKLVCIQLVLAGAWTVLAAETFITQVAVDPTLVGFIFLLLALHEITHAYLRS